MGTLKPLAAAFALVAIAAPAAAQPDPDPVARWAPLIAEASTRFGIPAGWIERVMRAESGGQLRLNGRPITSPAGAMGLMQLMPETWADMRATLGLGADPYNPRDNIFAGTAYLRRLYWRFGYPGLFAAYNAGPARYAAYLAGERPLPAETKTYLRKASEPGHEVTPAAVTAQALHPLFAVRADRSDVSWSPPHNDARALFAIHLER